MERLVLPIIIAGVALVAIIILAVALSRRTASRGSNQPGRRTDSTGAGSDVAGIGLFGFAGDSPSHKGNGSHSDNHSPSHDSTPSDGGGWGGGDSGGGGGGE